MYGFDMESYYAALDQVPRWSHDQVTRVMEFFTHLAGLIAELSMNNIRLARTLAEHERNVP